MTQSPGGETPKPALAALNLHSTELLSRASPDVALESRYRQPEQPLSRGLNSRLPHLHAAYVHRAFAVRHVEGTARVYTLIEIPTGRRVLHNCRSEWG